MANSYLSRTLVTGNRTTFTFSAWVKRSKISSTVRLIDVNSAASPGGSYYSSIFFTSTDELRFYSTDNGVSIDCRTDMKFRDVSAWYHVVVVHDTTQASSSDRIKMYVNGTQQSITGTIPGQNADNTMFNYNLNPMSIGRRTYDNSEHFDGYMSHVAFVDGTALTPTSFGEIDATSGIWKFKPPSSITWGNNGFHLKFENSGNMGLDSSGETHNFTTSGDLKQSLDTPSNNYTTFSPLHYGDTPPSTTYGAFSNGNTTYASSQGGSPYPYTCSTLAASSGKWYAEFKLTRIVNSSMVGITDGAKYSYLGDGGNKDACLFHDGNFYPGNSSFGNSFSDNDICGVAMDLDNMKVYFSKNGTWQNSGVPTSGATGTGAANIPTGGLGQFHFAFGDSSSNDPACSANFGNGFFGTTAITSAGSNGNGSLFECDVPSGYYALNTKNLNTYG